MSLKFSQIRPQTTEIAALKRVKKFMFPFFLALYNGSQVSIVALWATCFINLNDKKVFIPKKNITIDFRAHQLVPLPLYCSLLRKNALHVSCRVFFFLFFFKSKTTFETQIKFFHIFLDGKISGKTQSWPQVWKTQKIRLNLPGTKYLVILGPRIYKTILKYTQRLLYCNFNIKPYIKPLPPYQPATPALVRRE